jgi:isopenicillin-N epimerase
MDTIKDQFLLDPEVVFLNHGSFGAVPRVVFEAYQRWHSELEKQPVKFLGRDIFDHFRNARKRLGGYLGADPNCLVFIPNATFGVNLVTHSLDLKKDDEVIISNHEYGACENAWKYITKRSGAKLISVDIPLPLPPPERISNLIWEATTKRTKLIFLSQITSPTAIRLPVEEISQRANEEGIMVFIDGAHAPGQIPVDLEGLGADFYTGNCHKWMMAPKGSAFLYSRLDRQDLLEPLIVSWGWGDNSPYVGDTKFFQEQEWWGTINPASYLSVSAAIQFHEDNNWDVIRQQCSSMLSETIREIENLTGLPSIYGENRENFVQIAAAELPEEWHPEKIQGWLYDKYRIEIPVIKWEGRWLIRPSVQGYNTQKELSYLLSALEEYLIRMNG